MANDSNMSNKNDTVIVGCKLPHGYIMEIIPKPNESWQPPPAGPRMSLNGANTVASDSPVYVNPRIFGYGRTVIPREFWDRWFAQNKDREVVAKGFIFAEAKEPDFRAHARDGLSEQTGLEGLNPNSKDDPRLRKLSKGGGRETVIETDEQHLRKLQQSMDRVGA